MRPKKPTAKPVTGVFRGSGRNRTVFFKDIGLVDNFLVSEDLNECVAAILFRKTKKPPRLNHTATPKSNKSKSAEVSKNSNSD